jgi:hypothetical protein
METERTTEKVKTAGPTVELASVMRRRRRTAFGQLRKQAEHRRRGANLFVAASLMGIVALVAVLALLAR